MALQGYLPKLTGDLATDSAEIINNPSRQVQHMRASTGILPGAST